MKFKRLIALVISISMCLSFAVYAEEAPAAGQVETAEKVSTPILTDGEMAKILVEQSANLILSRYKYDVTREELYEATLMEIMQNHPELIEEAYEAMFSSLDEHTQYYTKEEYKYFLENMSGEFAGIGVVITMLPEGLLITSVTAESSGGAAGLKQGDIITTADGVSIVGMSLEQARTYIVGEIGTTVTIGIMRGSEYLEYTITRKPVIVEPGRYQILDGNIGYIELQSFDGSAPELVNHALDEFDKNGVENIIFDLRYNAGGSVNVLLEVCQRIIPQGPIIRFEYKDENKNFSLYSECKDPKYSLIVLANEYSASASEAFCGAVQDSGIGIVVGTKTYGKGTMQNLTKFRVGGGIKLTEAEYLTRDGRHIDGTGIVPDYYEDDKIIRMSKAAFNDFDFETKMKLGDKSPVVLALNQRLYALGYDVGIPTDEFTQDTYNAVYQFQSTQGLFPYGVCDITTQLAIENIMQKHEFSNEQILKTAMEIFRTGTLSKYLNK
ncbi:MAG: S41 family peptidase [Clostridia bacterium]|nr:S41 family peptidase [Clostridia bacterium]